MSARASTVSGVRLCISNSLWLKVGLEICQGTEPCPFRSERKREGERTGERKRGGNHGGTPGLIWLSGVFCRRSVLDKQVVCQRVTYLN